MLKALLDKLPNNKDHVHASPTSAEPALRFRKLSLSNYLKAAKDDTAKQLSHNVQQSNSPPVIADRQIPLLGNGHNLRIDPVLWYLPLVPHCLDEAKETFIEKGAVDFQHFR